MDAAEPTPLPERSPEKCPVPGRVCLVSRLQRLVGRLTYANVTATLALFVALGGASYAAIELPAHSVGPRQLRRGAVTPQALGFPLRVSAFTDSTPIDLPKYPCNTPLPPGQHCRGGPEDILKHVLGDIQLSHPGEVALSGIAEVANDGPPGTDAEVRLGVFAYGQDKPLGAFQINPPVVESRVAKVAGGQVQQIPLLGLFRKPSGRTAIGFGTIGIGTYSSDAPGDLVIRSVSIIATALPAT